MHVHFFARPCEQLPAFLLSQFLLAKVIDEPFVCQDNTPEVSDQIVHCRIDFLLVSLTSEKVSENEHGTSNDLQCNEGVKFGNIQPSFFIPL